MLSYAPCPYEWSTLPLLQECSQGSPSERNYCSQLLRPLQAMGETNKLCTRKQYQGIVGLSRETWHWLETHIIRREDWISLYHRRTSGDSPANRQNQESVVLPTDRNSEAIIISSSLRNRPGTSPVVRRELMISKKDSSLISASVNKKDILMPCLPQLRFRFLRSSERLFMLHILDIGIWNVWQIEQYEASRVRLCFPLPPTPTEGRSPYAYPSNVRCALNTS